MALMRNHKLIMVLVILSLCLPGSIQIPGFYLETLANQAVQPTVKLAVQPDIQPTIRPMIQPTVQPTARPTLLQPAPTRLAQPGLIKLAVLISTNAVEIPTFGTLKWYKDGLAALVEKEVSAAFPASKYSLTPSKIIANALAESGYSLNYLEMPEKGGLIEIANNAGADAILVIELAHIGLSTTQDQYQFYVILRCKAYNVREDTYMARKIIYEGEQFKHEAPEKDRVYYSQTIINALDLALSALPF
ncbi:MAG: PT domain-containing protein [Firmicutes bacterium]|nr:PT domain-containing protein [Bacillota bacterium]